MKAVEAWCDVQASALEARHQIRLAAHDVVARRSPMPRLRKSVV